MALADNISAITRILSLNVRIAGVRLRPVDATDPGGVPAMLRLRISKSLDSPVPVATITVNRMPTWINRGQTVTIDLGFGGLRTRVFTGTVQDRAAGAEESDINCTGRLFAAFRTVEIPERSVDGLTVEAALENVLDYVGLTTNRSITSGGFTLGSASDAKLSRSTSSQMLQTIMDVEGYKIYEDGSGTIIIRAVDGPAPTPFKSLSTDTTATARIVGGRSREDPGFTRTRVTVVGATVVEGSDPDETSRTISQSASLIGETPVQPPLPANTFIDTEFSNHLIDTNAQALTVAKRLLTNFARVPRQTLLEIPGDPQAEIGQTWQLDFPELNLAGRFYVHGVQHNLTEQGYTTVLDVRGGDEFGGTVALEPHASFFYTVEREVLDDSDRVWAFVTFDAQASYDPDGSIASYAWSDDETTTPEIATLTTAVVTVRIDPTTITGDWTVTLTVTDNDGLTDAISFVVDVGVGAALVQIPSVFAAIDNNMSASPDGAQNWNDDADTDVLAVAAAPPDGVNTGRAVYGLADGSIMLTTDFLATDATEVKAANSDAIQDIAWDWRDSRKVWALDDTFTLWVSTDSGASFVEIADIATIFSIAGAVGKHIGLPAGTDVWLYGGDGANNPVIVRSTSGGGGGGWVQLTFGGELDSDLPAASADFRIVDAQNTGAGAGLVIICENADAGDSGVRPIYHSSSGGHDPSDWKRATGLAAGDVDGRYVVGARGFPRHFIAGFADRDAWKSTDGIAWTETATVLPANTVPHHCIWLEEEIHGLYTAGVYILACENTSDQSKGIFKSADELATVGVLRPVAGFDAWPASAIGRQVAVGPPSVIDGLDLYAQLSGGDQETLRLTAAAAWTEQSTDADDNNWGLKNLNDNLYRIANRLVSTDMGGPGDLERSTDNGATWSVVKAKDVPNARGVQAVTIGPDGTLWLAWGSHTDTTASLIIYKSTDDGATWGTAVYTDGGSGASALLPADIAVHPTNPGIVVVTVVRNSGGSRLVESIDADDASPTFTIRTLGVTASGTSGLWVTFADSGRIVVGGGGSIIQTTDDRGVSWVTRHNPGGTASAWICRFQNRLLYSVSTTAGDAGTVYISTDQGTTWTKYVSGSDFTPDTTVVCYGACLDQNGGLCLAWSGATLSDEWYRISAPWITVPAPAADWDRIGYNADSLGTGSMPIMGLAAGPDTQ